MSAAANNDADLVVASLSGNRDAFGQIVSRYQSLICSLAYSATGSLGASEDLAQETFITAWKHLGHLRERHKLRAWLCGIARNRINSSLRREGREPVRGAEPLDTIPEPASCEPLPHDQTISKEEEAILWRSLERVPEIYREPLILFYREHQSIETVAMNLDLTEDAVKQRLSRGRKILQEQVLAFVEGALERTNPGKTFTLGVLAALPLVASTSAKAAALVAAAKGGGAKAAGALGVLGMLLSPLMLIFGNYLPYRIGLAEARSEAERQHIKSFYHRIWCVTFGLFALLATLVLWAAHNRHDQTVLEWFSHLLCGLVVIYLLTMFAFVMATARKQKKYLTQILEQQHGGIFPPATFEYRSKFNFLGMPLVHIRIGGGFALLRKPVKAWIAVANFAAGGLFAFGAVAIAPFSIGGLAVGLFAMGGFTAGLFVLGGIGLGIWACGGLVFGWQALGGCAIAWNAAIGGLAWAHDYALGSFARAAQANNEIASQFAGSAPFFRWMRVLNRHWFWLNLLWVAPLFIQWRIVAKQKSSNSRVSNSN